MSGDAPQLVWNGQGVSVASNLSALGMATDSLGGTLLAGDAPQLAWNGQGVSVTSDLSAMGLTAGSSGGTLLAGDAPQLVWNGQGVSVTSDLCAPGLTSSTAGGSLAAGGAAQLAWSQAGLTAGGLTCNSAGGSLTADGAAVLAWAPGQANVTAASGSITAAPGVGVAEWGPDGALHLTGPVTISASGPPVDDTANAQLVAGNVTSIRPSLTCAGDLVTTGGGVFVLSDERTKTCVRRRDQEADLAILRRLAASDFRYGSDRQPRVGLMAGEVQRGLPEAVRRTRFVGSDIALFTSLTPSGVGAYAVPGVPAPRCQVEVSLRGAPGPRAGWLADGILTGDFGSGGDAFVRGPVLEDCLCLDYQALAAVHVNASAAMACRIEALEASLGQQFPAVGA